jgi:group II intron reverse transcriptase/maturase
VFNNIWHLLTEDFLHEAYQSLPSWKAIGIDKVTKEKYEKDLHRNIRELYLKIQRGHYRPQAARIVQIPKEDGSTRPLAISCLEDKIVQKAVNRILEAIHEPLFLPYSYGFRPKHNCHEALKALMRSTYTFGNGALIEIDIRKCFNRIPHDLLLTFLKQKISDQRFLKLVEKLITTPVLEDGKEEVSIIGCPQGSIMSPILCNVYLHYVIDEWFSNITGTHLKGKSELIRYADDMVFVFEQKEDAERVFRVLDKRLNKYGLEMHEAKSALLPSGREVAKCIGQTGKRMPVFTFLGFTCYWGKARKGFYRLKLKSRSDRFTATLKRLRKYLRENLNCQDDSALLQSIIRRVKGWVNYHAVSDNGRRVGGFLIEVKRMLLRWFNRRSQRKAMNWDNLMKRLKREGFPETFKTISMFS